MLWVPPPFVLVALSPATPTTAPARVESWNRLSSGVAACGDIDGDGVPDLAVASRDRLSPDLVWIVSGKDGSLLRTLRGKHDRDGFGCHIVGVGDFDRDGTPDVAVGAAGGPVESYTRVLSGRSGDVLLEIGDCGEIAPVRDIEHDGHPVLIYTALPVPWSSRSTSAVVLRSGQSDKQPIEFHLPGQHGAEIWAFGDSLCWAGDVDGDGRQDIAVSSVQLRKPGSLSKARGLSVAVFSSKDAHCLWEYLDVVEGVCDNDSDGDESTLRIAGDLDGDGTPDLVVGIAHRYGLNFSSSLLTLSGKRGTKLSEASAVENLMFECQASTLDVVGDLNRDGVQDWVLALKDGDRVSFQFGLVRVVSGRTGQSLLELEYSKDYGFSASGVGDINADGIPDIAELVERERDPSSDPVSVSAVSLRSGKDGRMIWQKILPEFRRASAANAPK